MIAIVFANDEPDREEALDSLLRYAEFVEHGTPASRRITDAESLRGGAIQLSTLEVILGVIILLEIRLVVALHLCKQLEQFVVSSGRALTFLARDLYSHRRSQALDSLDEAHMVVLHQEAQCRAVRTAAKTVIEALVGTDRERGRLLVMKWAIRLEFAPCLLELNAFAQYLNDIGTRNQIVNEMLRNQAAHNLF